MLGLAILPGVLVAAIGTIAAPHSGSATVNTTVAVIMGLAGLGTIVGIVYGAKWKTAHAVEHALNEALDERVKLVIHERDELAGKLDQATFTINEANKTIARLEALPNLERVLELVAGTFDRLGQRMDARFDKVDQQLGQIGEKQ